MFHFKRTFAGQLNCVWVFLSNFLFASDVFVFFVPNIKCSHGVITPQTWIEGKWLKCVQQLQTQCCDIQKKKEEEETKQYVSTTHILVHFELNHTSPCAAFMLQIEYLQGLFYAFSHTSMHVYISHAELLVLLHYCLLLSYLSLVGNSTGHCNDPGKTIQKWSESTFFPLPLSLPLLTTER